MSLVMMALLPKLHLNRNTSRAIIFSPEELGGLVLPHFHTLQGTDKLKLFLGHLHLQDRTSQLIHINLGYIQLLTGIAGFFLNCDYAQFSWVEPGWVTSLWEFTSQSNITFNYPLLCRPSAPREYGKFLMDYFMNLKLSHKTLEILNHCRMYLKVITLSDIVTANGLSILPEVKLGCCRETRISTLQWPNQGRPAPSDWMLWKAHLDSLEQHGRLCTPLGLWVGASHQVWQHFIDVHTNRLYILDGDSAKCFPTRSGPQYWFDVETGIPSRLIPTELLPATIIRQPRLMGSLASVVHSQNSLQNQPPRSQTSNVEKKNLYDALLQEDSIPYLELAWSQTSGKLTISVSTSGKKMAKAIHGRISFPANREIYSMTHSHRDSSKYQAKLFSLLIAVQILVKLKS